MTHSARAALRQAKNFAKGYTDIEQKVREATSNDPWGAPGTLMSEIAEATYNSHDFLLVMKMLDKRLNDSGKNWRHVFKALTLLDYLIHLGSEQVVKYAKENLYIVKTLKEFQYIDEDGKDQGQNVRQKAKDITSLLVDEERLREERLSRQSMRDRMTGRTMHDNGYIPSSSAVSDRYPKTTENALTAQEERDLERAIAESKKMAMEQKGRPQLDMSEDEQLRRAIELSKEEEAKRQARTHDEKDMIDLFDNGYASNPYNQISYTPQQQSFDPFGKPLQQQMMGGTQSFDAFGTPHMNQTFPHGNAQLGQYGDVQVRQNNPFGGRMGMSGYVSGVSGATGVEGNGQNLGSDVYSVNNNLTADNPNARLANVVKNSQQIDPFTGMAARTNTTGNKFGSNTPPFASLSIGSSSFNPFAAVAPSTQPLNLYDSTLMHSQSEVFGSTSITSNPSQTNNAPPKSIVDLDNLVGGSSNQPTQNSSPVSFSAALSKNPFSSSGSGSNPNLTKQYDWGIGKQNSGQKNKTLNELAGLTGGMSSSSSGQFGGFGLGNSMAMNMGVPMNNNMGTGTGMGGMGGMEAQMNMGQTGVNPFNVAAGQNNKQFSGNRGW